MNPTASHQHHLPNRFQLPAQALRDNTPADPWLLMPPAPAGPPQEAGRRRPSEGLNLALVIDRSSSMRSNGRLTRAKQVAIQLAESLRRVDTVSVVAFSNRIDVVASGVSGAAKGRVRERISALEAGGRSNLHAGWLAGAHQVATHYLPGAPNQVIVISDGGANCGLCSASRVLEHVALLRTLGISTSSVAMGLRAGAELLREMAVAGHGSYRRACPARPWQPKPLAPLLTLPFQQIA